MFVLIVEINKKSDISVVRFIKCDNIKEKFIKIDIRYFSLKKWVLLYRLLFCLINLICLLNG